MQYIIKAIPSCTRKRMAFAKINFDHNFKDSYKMSCKYIDDGQARKMPDHHFYEFKVR